MREPVFKLILHYLDQLISAVSSIGFYDHVIEDIEFQKKQVVPVHEDFKAKVENQEHLATLSVQEQYALGKNELNYKRLIQGMDEAISTLIRQKWSNNVRTVLWLLDDAKLTVEYMLDEYALSLTEIVGQEIRPPVLFKEDFNKKPYLSKLTTTQIVVGTLIDDIIGDSDLVDNTKLKLQKILFLKNTLSLTLGKCIMVLQREYDYTEEVGLPKPYTFDTPKIEEPEVPDYPVEAEKEPEPEGVVIDGAVEN